MRFFKAFRLMAFVYLLAICAPLWAQQPVAYESYGIRPAIEDVTAKEYQITPLWNKLRPAHFDMVATLLEMYPHHELYFLARDSELLYDAARLATADNPKEQQRLHLLNVSRTNMEHPLLYEYLAQEGMGENDLKNGKKVLLVDTGFDGTIPKAIGELLSYEVRKNIQTHLIVSRNPDHPSTRTFLSHFGFDVGALDVDSIRQHVIHGYENIPRYTERSRRFVIKSGKVEAVSLPIDPKDVESRRILALAYMKSLKAYWQEPATQERFKTQREITRELYNSFIVGTENSPQKLAEKVERLSQRYGAKRVNLVLMDLLDATKNINVRQKQALQNIIEERKDSIRGATAIRCNSVHVSPGL